MRRMTYRAGAIRQAPPKMNIGGLQALRTACGPYIYIYIYIYMPFEIDRAARYSASMRSKYTYWTRQAPERGDGVSL